MELPRLFRPSQSFAVRLTWRIVGRLFLISLVLAALFLAVIWTIGFVVLSAFYWSGMDLAGEKINNVFTAVEIAVSNNITEAEESINGQENEYFAIEHLLTLNPNIVGAAVAVNPEVGPYKGRFFAPYAYNDGTGIHTKQLTSADYDYTHQEWFIKPLDEGKGIWTDPYVDKGGGEVLMITYSMPIINSKGDPIFESCCFWPPSIADIVNKEGDLAYFVDSIPDQLRQYGRKTVKAFGINRRFVHLEFFRLDREHIGLGKQGDFVALEVNMRPAGGFTPDMMNYSWSTNVYQIYADMVAFDENRTSMGQVYHCAYASQRDNKGYDHSREEINRVYAGKIMNQEPIPKVLSGAMGDYMFLGRLDTVEEVNEFIHFVTDRQIPS